MYICNMLKKEPLFTQRSKPNTLPFRNDFTDTTFQGYVCVDDKCITVKAGESKDDLFAVELDKERSFLERLHLTNQDIADTDENPLITTICAGIEVLEGIPSYIKILPIGRDMLVACLVFGACQFVGADGDGVLLQRCYSNEISDTHRCKRFDTKDCMDLVVVKDEESDYNMFWDCVTPVLFKVGPESSKYKVIREDLKVFYEDNMMAARQRKKDKEMHIKLAREEEKKKRLEAERLDAERREKLRREEAGEFEDVSAGAAAFLSAVSMV